MNAPIRVTIPHQLGRAEARRRIDDGLVRLKPRIAEIARSVDYRWNGDDMGFQAEALGQSLHGRLTVHEASVDVEVSLQGMLGLFKETAAERIKHHAIRLLAPKNDR